MEDELLRNASWIRRLSATLIGDQGAGDDALQDTWLSARLRPPETPAAPGAWLRTVARNHLLNRRRQDRRRAARDGEVGHFADAPESPEEVLGRLQIHEALVQEIRRLPEPYRQTVLLRYFDGLCSTEIAERLNVPAGTVRGRLKTALDELRTAMDARYGSRRTWACLVALPTGTGLGLKLLLGVALLTGFVVIGSHLREREPYASSSAPDPLRVATHPLRAARPAEPPTASPPAVAPAATPTALDVPAPSTPPSQEGVPTATAPVATTNAAAPAPLTSGSGAAVTGPVISGVVRLLGTPPAMPMLKMRSDPLCARQPSARDEEVVVGAGGALANVVVRIAKGLSGSFPVPVAPAILDQRGCLYRPRVLVAQAGQRVAIKNSDQTLHNVHTYKGPTTLFNQAQVFGMPAIQKTFTTGDIVKFKCDVHPWMTGWVLVTDNPFFAVTGDDGRFTLAGVPPGRHTLEVWHERFGTLSRQVEVQATVSELAFTFDEQSSPANP